MKTYKVRTINHYQHNSSSLEKILNDQAQEGFEFKFSLTTDSNTLVLIMEKDDGSSIFEVPARRIRP